ncbi:hypothetical protein [Staphylococcus casei]|uniref:Uncharacterized protein n=1 Tax=Staphylococcus casei TaxID=201828 RepID=A0ABZ2WC39_9STAP
MSTLKEICKEQTEMIDEMRQNIRELNKESDQYKAERDTLIDDLKVLRANNEKLERENRDYKIANKNVADYGHEWKTEYHKVERKLEKVSTAYKTLTDHIRLKASANPGVARYIALVNFVDRLEQK